jgi:hypothetical protein
MRICFMWKLVLSPYYTTKELSYSQPNRKSEEMLKQIPKHERNIYMR